MASGGWGPGPGPGQPGGNGPGGQGWGDPYGPPPPAPRPAPRRRSPLRHIPLVNIAAAVMRSAHRVATRLFVQDGDGRIADRTVERVQVARTVLGVLAGLALIYVYGVEEDRWKNAADDSFGNMIMTPVLLICTGPLVILGFILYAPPHLRPRLRSRLGAPLKAVGWYLLAIVVFGTVVYLAGQTGLFKGLDGWQAGLAAVVVLVVVVWGLPFLLLASLYSARSAFNTAHVHPMLPAVVTGVLVWALAIFNLAVKGMPEGPPPVQLSSLLGGPLSVTAVSLWELHRMRTRFGVTVRG
ncbi:hypothetical protein [Streptomyces sp. XD-27]|uniref:hypothetical protein n=1 Tax=Streptomyces sp. XD-27 TaxID=3062779 RepID=UPI0026F469D5|nr:hypothetical protein [Streptomyces sp. XD-27]WKX72306.1 hypothetical protein Q3Y56_22535 [Streptomyces sp. XD-27]